MRSSVSMISRRLRLSAALAWTVCALAVLVFGFRRYGESDGDIAFYWLMLILTFPVGHLVALGITGLNWLLATLGFSALDRGGTITMLRDWSLFVGAAYVQWCVLVPRLWRALATLFHRDTRFRGASRL
jgi:hypothetical protein